MAFQSVDLTTRVYPLGMCDHSGFPTLPEDEADPTKPPTTHPVKPHVLNGQGYDLNELIQLRAQLRESLQEQAGLS